MLLSSLISFFTVKIIMNTEAVLLKNKTNKQKTSHTYILIYLQNILPGFEIKWKRTSEQCSLLE